MRKRLFPYIASLPAIVLLTGCVSTTAPDFEGEAWYQAGYTDGCATAVERGKSFSTKAVRDEALYETDAGYRTGWRQGFAACDQRSRRDDGTFTDEQNRNF